MYQFIVSYLNYKHFIQYLCKISLQSMKPLRLYEHSPGIYLTPLVLIDLRGLFTKFVENVRKIV